MKSDGWRTDETTLATTLEIWGKLMGMEVDPTIYKGKKAHGGKVRHKV